MSSESKHPVVPAQNDAIQSIVTFLKSKISQIPRVGIICGSGLGRLSESMTNTTTYKYEDIPGFPKSTVHGHAGELVFGDLSGQFTVCMRGRFHYYEGYNGHTVTLPVRVFCGLGVKYVIVTNAAGGVNPKFEVGDVMLINDHFSVCQAAGEAHPLRGPNDARFGDRFSPLNNVYCEDLQQKLLKAKDSMESFQRTMHIGCYARLAGPTYETPHEIEWLRVISCDTVGMSTAPETIVASHCGMKVLAMSVVTNKCVGLGDPKVPPHHHEVLEATKGAEKDMIQLVAEFVKLVDPTDWPETRGFLHFEQVAKDEKAKAEKKKKESVKTYEAFTTLLGAAVVFVGAYKLLGKRSK